MEFKEDKISFSFILTFNPNPFFSNTEISKTYIFNNSQEIIKTESPTINWTSNELNPTKMLKKTQKKSKKYLFFANSKETGFEEIMCCHLRRFYERLGIKTNTKMRKTIDFKQNAIT